MLEKRPDRLRCRVVGGLLLCGCATALAFSACTYDEDDPCGDDLAVYGDNVRCVCPEGSIYAVDGCIECGEHEVVDGSRCVCEAGYEPSDGGGCEESTGSGGTGGAGAGGAPGGDDGVLGAQCDPAASTCAAPYDQCEPDPTSPYCTHTCSTSEDCEGGYRCNDAGICQRPPSGLMDPCTTSEDCAGNEASYCVQNACLVPDCTLDPDDCFAGYECCNLTALGIGTVCIPDGGCAQ